MVTKSIHSSLSRQKKKSKSRVLIKLIVTGVGVVAVLSVIASCYLALELERQKDTAIDRNKPSHTIGILSAARNSFQQAQQQAHGRAQQQAPPSIELSPKQQDDTTTTLIQQVREQFDSRYGEYAENLKSSIQRYGSTQATATRLLRAAAQNRPFVLAFAGYSVTVGRGNYLHQSYPFVLERILKPLYSQSILNLDVVVRNAAIGGIPSFPYGFCFEHFLGADADVISWDYSLNEGGRGKQAAVAFESYLRHSQHQLPNRPMVIALDVNKQRCSTLQIYTEQGLVADGLCVGMAKDVLGEETVKRLNNKDNDESKLPHGLQHWKDFGAPQGCPGRGSWHPKKMEHELIAWLMSLHFVDALEEAHKMVQQDAHWKQTYATEQQSTPLKFPPTLVTPPKNSADVTGLLYGHATHDTNELVLNPISCRTNFLPAIDHDKVLPSIVVSGLAPGVSADNILESRSDDSYQSGWVLDVSQLERETKVKVNKCDAQGLGYIDMKIALYGIPESGPLRLWLPLEGVVQNDDRKDSQDAKDWFDGLVICEANEKRPADACSLDTDLEYTVGGVRVDSTIMIAGAGEYLKRKTCANVGIPDQAQVTRLKDVTTTEGHAISPETRIRLAGPNASDNDVGLLVDIQAKSNVRRDKGACCVSHIVWEQH